LGAPFSEMTSSTTATHATSTVPNASKKSQAMLPFARIHSPSANPASSKGIQTMTFHGNFRIPSSAVGLKVIAKWPCNSRYNTLPLQRGEERPRIYTLRNIHKPEPTSQSFVRFRPVGKFHSDIHDFFPNPDLFPLQSRPRKPCLFQGNHVWDG
jgi:hypothetical protein